MEIQGDKIVIDKEEFARFFLFQEIAVKALEATSGLSQEELISSIFSKVKDELEKMKTMYPEELDQMINTYVNGLKI